MLRHLQGSFSWIKTEVSRLSFPSGFWNFYFWSQRKLWRNEKHKHSERDQILINYGKISPCTCLCNNLLCSFVAELTAVFREVQYKSMRWMFIPSHLMAWWRSARWGAPEPLWLCTDISLWFSPAVGSVTMLLPKMEFASIFFGLLWVFLTCPLE